MSDQMRAEMLLPAVLPVVFQRDETTIRLALDLESILGYVVVGVIVGLFARLLVPGRDPVGLLGTILIGVVGAVVGGWLAGTLFEETPGVDWIASIAVAAVLVLLLRRASTRRRVWGRR